MQILISVGGIQFDSIVNTCKYCNLNASASHQYLANQHQWNSWASFTVYLFSQFSSFETLLSLEAKPADAWSFMIWLAIICHGIICVRPLLWLLGHLEATSMDTFFFYIKFYGVWNEPFDTTQKDHSKVFNRSSISNIYIYIYIYFSYFRLLLKIKWAEIIDPFAEAKVHLKVKHFIWAR